MIVVIDDDFRVLESLENLLISEGFDVELFESADHFLASGDLEQVQCLVTDLEMPGTKGDELVKVLRAKEVVLPVVVISGHRDNFDRTALLDLGADAFFPKPFDPDAVLGTIRSLISANCR